MSSIWLEQLQTLQAKALSTLPGRTKPNASGQVKKIALIDSNKLVDIKDWSTRLHPTEFSETCSQLYRVLPDIVALKTDAETRFEMLQILHPVAIDAAKGLQQLIFVDDKPLDESKREALIIIQAIHRLISLGYLECFITWTSRRKLKSADVDHAISAAGNALFSFSCLLKNIYCVYGSVPSGVWLSMHSVFQVCIEKKIQFKTYHYDRQAGVGTTLKGLYLVSCILAAARTNQLSVRSIETLFELLLTYSDTADMGKRERSSALFWIDPLQDTGPRYAEPFGAHTDRPISEHAFSIELNKLTERIKRADQNKQIPLQISQHLLPILTKKPERSDKRLPQSSAELKLVIGMSDIHQALTNGQSFKEFVGTDRNFVPRSDSPFDLGGDDHKATKPAEEQNAVALSILNKSESGYCLALRGDIPGDMESGQVVALDKQSGELIAEAATGQLELGVVRWIKRFKNGAKIGVQILARNVRPAAVSQSFDMGGYSDYVRALLFSIGQQGETSFISTQSVIKPFSKIKLFDGVDESRANTDECILATGRIRQFTYSQSAHEED